MAMFILYGSIISDKNFFIQIPVPRKGRYICPTLGKGRQGQIQAKYRQLNMIRNDGRQAFLESQPVHFSRVLHDYSDEQKGFILNDKYIARMYSDLRGSTYMRVLRGLLANKTITEADLGGFSETTRNTILEIRRMLADD